MVWSNREELSIVDEPWTSSPTAEQVLESASTRVIYEVSGGLGERNTPDTEVRCRGGEQAHYGVGSLKPLQDLLDGHRAL